jgi:hypothetical protein
VNKRDAKQAHRHNVARRAKNRYIPKDADYKLHFIGMTLWLEGFTAGLRHAKREAAQPQRGRAG